MNRKLSKNICESCQQMVEEFYDYRTSSRSILKEEHYSRQADSSKSPCNTDNNYSASEVPVLENAVIETKNNLLSNAIPSNLEVSSDSDIPEPDEPIELEPAETRKRPRRPTNFRTEAEKAMTPDEFKKHISNMFRERYKQICDICGRALDPPHVEGHMNRHNGVTPYTCDSCGTQFYSKANLRSHVKRNHSSEDPIPCEHCEKVLVSRIAYKNHLWAVHAERKFECKVCKLKVLTKHTLNIHMDIHNQKRDFVCNYCGKRFLRRFVLRIHLRTHTGETPYQCSVCGEAFIHRRIYVMHMKKAHPGEPIMRIDGTKAFREAIRRQDVGKFKCT
ncbi:zinc finger protein 182-like isoform X2 [Uranotaenia lowii]|nr:zinc finger protein 182-like isoform X2 [Uranotaenia lowii]